MASACGFLAPRTSGRARLDALCLSLRDAGGGSAARTYTHALDRLLSLRDLREEATALARRESEGRGEGARRSAAAAECAAANGGVGGALGAVAWAAAAVVDVAWEKLHTGDWKDVDVAWRDLYVLGAMLRVSAELQQHARATETLAVRSPTEAGGLMTPPQALRALDMAALLGGPGFRDELEVAIAEVQAVVTRQLEEEDDARDQTKAEEPASNREGCEPSDEVRRNTNGREGTSSMKRPRGEQSEGEAKVGRAPRVALDEWRLGGDIDGDRAEEDAGGSEGDDLRYLSTLLPPASLGGGASLLRGPVQRLVSPPSLESFYCNHMSARSDGVGVPVVISGAASHWPALRRWKDPEYLRWVAGCRTVPVEVGEHYLHGGWNQKLMTLADFLEDHVKPRRDDAGGHSGDSKTRESSVSKSGGEKQKGYLAQHALFEQIPALLGDIDLPDYCALSQASDIGEDGEEGGEEGGVKAVNAWLGPAGTVSPLHTDPYHNLLSQAVGRKYVRLYAPSLAPAMYPHEEPKLSNSSRVDLRLEAAQLEAEGFPLFLKAPFLDCVLGPGDMLYIPPKWFHYVQSLTSSFSVSFWWQ